MKATATVTPEATPFTLLGQSSPSRSQGIVPTPAPNTENSRKMLHFQALSLFT